MLGRTARQAARVAHGPPKRAVSAPRLTRSYATPAPASGPHERSSGMNSTVAGLGVFGATLLLGFVMGALPDHSKRETALQKLGAGSPGNSKTASVKSAAGKAVKAVSKKADEAAETVSSKVASKTSKKAKSGSSKAASSASESSSPSVSATGATTPLPSLDEPASVSEPASPTSSTSDPGSLAETEESMSDLEGEGDASQAAFNPETGEINWDCPCLGGMAHGVCGEQFKEAFSCFVYSEEEPKGQDCIEKFRAMQDCFRAHPEIYGEDVTGPDDEDEHEYDVVSAVEAALAEEAQKP